jgi:transketolase
VSGGRAGATDPASWSLRSPGRTPSFVAGEVLAELGRTDERIVVLTADLEFSNGTHAFREAWPQRFFNLGIAERNMVSVAAGMAAMGLVPYVGSFAAFLALSCAEQISTDLAWPEMKVRLLAHHAGFSLGYYGTSHHATEDLGLLRSIPGLTIVAPCDAASLAAALVQSLDLDGPVYLRLGRGRDPDVYQGDAARAWRLGSLALLRPGTDLAVLAHGATVAPALEAAAELARDDGLDVAVADVHTLRPLDESAVLGLATSCRLGVLVAEEHDTTGGLASAVADLFVATGASVPLHRLGVPGEYVPVGPPSALYRHYGLDAAGIAKAVRELAAGGAPTR